MKTHSLGQERFAIAQRDLLHPNDLDVEILLRTLGGLQGNGVDYADLYFETTTRESWRLVDECVTNGGYSVSQGVGIRTVAGDRSALAYSSDLTPRALAATADAARRMTATTSGTSRQITPTGFRSDGSPHALYRTENIIANRSAQEKIALLQDIDRRIRAIDPRLTRVTANLRLTDSMVLIAASDGTLAADIRPLLQINVSVTAEANGKRSRGGAGAGGRYGLDALNETTIDRLVERASHTALVNLDARPAPAGVMPVVCGPGFPGVLFHEAVGHGLEGDAHYARSSAFVHHMDKHVAAPGVTVIDDGTLPGRAGSLNIDDEGVPTERTVLIENGRLTGLMQDRMNARLMNGVSTGNARRESYACLPMPRMTNTFLAPGDHDPADIIASVQRGIYAAEFGGGSVDTTSGQFNFSAVRAYLIEEGKITAPISGATLIGVGHEALKHVSMIGHDLALDEGEAVCGKEGQSVFVGVGQPTIRIDEMIVGGNN